jgi:ElaB/YqjD/DUF883 family membrane-anchored ribosome-binding protein
MSKEIAFTINVEDAALQQLLKDLGALVTQHDKLVKSQDATAKSNMLLVQAQEKLNQVQKRVWQQGQQTQIQMQATCLSDLIFTKLQFSYIIIGLSVQYLYVYSECFLCTPRSTSDGSRAYTFGIQQHTIPFEPDMKLISSISVKIFLSL